MTSDPTVQPLATFPATTPIAAPAPEVAATVVLSKEQLRSDTEWVESGRVRLRRRIASEVRTIEVVVRREELIIETHDVAPGAVGESYRGTAVDGPAIPSPGELPPSSLVVVLREEVPEVVLRPRPYERVIAEIVTASEVAVLHDRVRHEEADVATTW